MRKLYSTIMMLALMVAALGLTSCPSSDEEDDDINNWGRGETVFSVTVNGYKYAYDEFDLHKWNLLGRYESKLLIGGAGDSEIVFKFPSNINFSSFTPGYSSFHKDANEITYGWRHYCAYESGSARVLSNDGKNMKIRFNNYTLMSYHDKLFSSPYREIILDGELNIVFMY